MKKLNNFIIQELVSPHVYNKFGKSAIRFFDPRLIDIIEFIRVDLDRKITVNNWFWGGDFTQRGLRENTCKIVREKTFADKMYLSAHVIGKAVDFDVQGMTAEEVRNYIRKNIKRFPHPVRIEKGVNWVHLDVSTDSDELIEF